MPSGAYPPDPRESPRDGVGSRPPLRDAPPPSRRVSITDRLRSSWNRARDSTTATVQRKTSSVDNRSATSRLREWLDTCNAEHHNHCSPPSGKAPATAYSGSESDSDLSSRSGSRPRTRPGEEPATWRPAWLIDVVEKNLVRAKPTDRYIALSYVWGTSPPPKRGSAVGPPEPPLQLMRSNIDALELGIPEQDIPLTISDAMWLAKKLGIRHLWVDRLCIVQDDDNDKESHIQHMAFVYSNAYLTIVAAHGDAYTGLTALNPRRTPRQPRTSSKEHNELLLASRWNTRGWTMQELLYSRRAVFFFEDTVTWECHCDLWQGPVSGPVKAVRPRQGKCHNRMSTAAFGFQHTPWPDMDEYARLAADYSARRVTYVDDTLRAFAGVTHVLSKVFPGGFLYGMPLMFLDVALLWRPQASIRRRAVTRPPFLPSWSWMGWWFDGVPVDLTLWRAATDYVEDTRAGKRGEEDRRFHSTHMFRIRPTVQWSLTDRNATAPVVNNGFQFRDINRQKSRRSSVAALPPGWMKAGSAFYKHDSDPDTVFKYPVPVEEPPEKGEYNNAAVPGEMTFPGPYLSFKTTSGIFEVDYFATLSPRDSMSPPIAVGNIKMSRNRWVGSFRAHDGWLGVQSSNYDGDERLEFLAISTAMERRGSHVFPPERFDEFADEDGIIDIVNVLWVERIGGVAYRRGVGHVLLKAWEAQARDEVDVLLG